VFAPATGHKAGEPVKDVKNGFHSALEIAEIKDFTWHDHRNDRGAPSFWRVASQSMSRLGGSQIEQTRAIG
jgi:hypothetical protein